MKVWFVMLGERHRSDSGLLKLDVFNLKLLARNDLEREPTLHADEGLGLKGLGPVVTHNAIQDHWNDFDV